MTLHFSQIGFTDDLTFTGNPPSVKYSIKICSLGRSYTHVQARPHCIVALWSTKCKQFFKFFLHFSNFFSFLKFETFFLCSVSSIIEEIPADRMGTPEEVAHLVWQVVNSPSYMTGQIISLDGGWI